MLEQHRGGRSSASIGVAPYNGTARSPARSCWWRPTWRCTRQRSAAATGSRCFDRDSAAPQPAQRPADLGPPDRAGADRRRLRAARPADPQPGRRQVPRHELLVRMRGENGDLIPPAAFLGVAERFELIQSIDRWVVARRRSRCSPRASRPATRCGSRSTSRPSRSPTPSMPDYIEDCAARGAGRPMRPHLRGDRDRGDRERGSRAACSPTASPSSAAASPWTTSAPASPPSTTSSTSTSTC